MNININTFIEIPENVPRLLMILPSSLLKEEMKLLTEAEARTVLEQTNIAY